MLFVCRLDSTVWYGFYVTKYSSSLLIEWEKKDRLKAKEQKKYRKILRFKISGKQNVFVFPFGFPLWHV